MVFGPWNPTIWVLGPLEIVLVDCRSYVGKWQHETERGGQVHYRSGCQDLVNLVCNTGFLDWMVWGLHVQGCSLWPQGFGMFVSDVLSSYPQRRQKTAK